MYICGLRISEPLRLKIGAINWQRFFEDETKHSLLKISRAKSKRERLVPINPGFTREIRNYIGDLSNPGRFIFDFNSEQYLKKKYRKAVRNKIGGFMFYEKEDELAEYRRSWVIGKYIDKERKAFQRVFRDASKKVTGEYHSPHILRKSRATAMLRAGVPILSVMNFLGHKDLKTTQKYLSFEIDQLTSSMSKLGL